MNNSTESINNIFQLLKELEKTNSFEVYLPSLQRNVSFKQLNTEQLKKILKASIDSPVYKTQFTLTCNNLIKENILDSSVNVNNLNIFDKLLFLLKTRIECITPEYTFYLTEEEMSEYSLTEESYTVNISDAYNRFVSNNPTYNEQKFNINNCEIVATLPNILTENKLEQELHENLNLQINSTDELRNTIGETFVNEITKYIKTLTVNQTSVDLNDLSFKERIKIVEQLSAPLINQILKYIESYREIIKSLTTYSINNLEKEIAFNATIFNL